jgi:hypothetical protein
MVGLPGQARESALPESVRTTPVPDRLSTRRLLLRPWRAADAARVQPVLEANAGHLGPWIPPRVVAPVPFGELAGRLAGFGADFAAGREWRYGLFSPDEEAVYGELGLYPRTAAQWVHFAEVETVSSPGISPGEESIQLQLWVYELHPPAART